MELFDTGLYRVPDGYTIEQLFATVKYYVLHPNERPIVKGWGSDSNYGRNKRGGSDLPSTPKPTPPAEKPSDEEPTDDVPSDGEEPSDDTDEPMDGNQDDEDPSDDTGNQNGDDSSDDGNVYWNTGDEDSSDDITKSEAGKDLELRLSKIAEFIEKIEDAKTKDLYETEVFELLDRFYDLSESSNAAEEFAALQEEVSTFTKTIGFES